MAQWAYSHPCFRIDPCINKHDNNSDLTYPVHKGHWKEMGLADTWLNLEIIHCYSAADGWDDRVLHNFIFYIHTVGTLIQTL